MYQICANTSLPGLELVCIISMSQISCWVMVLMIWQLLFSTDGLHPFDRATQTLPLSAFRTQVHFNLPGWLTKLARRLIPANYLCLLPTVFSPKFLLRRDGQRIFDFFKTLSLNDVSPPVLA